METKAILGSCLKPTVAPSGWTVQCAGSGASEVLLLGAFTEEVKGMIGASSSFTLGRASVMDDVRMISTEAVESRR